MIRKVPTVGCSHGRQVSLERAFGNFHRTFTLPSDVNQENVEATYDNGVLSIHVPKTEESKPQQIEIQ